MGNRFEMIKFTVLNFLLAFIFSVSGWAQNDHAMEGSPFAGGLGVANNPASIVNTPYPWDITVLSFQLKNSTNAVTFYDLSLISPSDSSKYGFNGGNYSRFINFNYNLHLLNARIALSRRSAIAFGANLRGYGQAKTSPYNYNDTLHNLNNFFSINQATPLYEGNFVSSSWIELFATYSKTILDDEKGRLNAGFTLKVSRGISGAFLQLAGGSVQAKTAGGNTYYSVNEGNTKFAYSSNYDTWNNGNSTGQNIKNFLNFTQAGASFDLGAEYLIKSQDLPDPDEEDGYFDYDWKIGVSLLDIGENRYKYGNYSRHTGTPKNAVDSILDRKFGSGLQTFAQFDDSLGTVENSISPLRGLFSIRDPARVVINVDRPLPDHFSVNLNLSINLTLPGKGQPLQVQEMNLLNLTPRWETKRWGIYLPIQYTTEKQLWIGGAFKAGPLLFGIHNWGNVLSKDKMQNGGGYIALIIRPGHGFVEKEAKQYECPKVLP
jgi:hypothetical protein